MSWKEFLAEELALSNTSVNIQLCFTRGSFVCECCI